MTNPHGSFIWYELITPDTVAAGRFYADVVGWTVGDFGGGADGGVAGYQVFSAGEAGVGGMMALPDGAMRPGWYGYIGVDDVDAMVAAIEAAGGRVHMPASDLPGVGRIAFVADPQGVPFYVMRGASDRSSEAFDPAATGHCAWNELATSDPAAALDFYTGLFGWTKGDAMSMGDMGDYRFLHHAGDRIGATMVRPPGGPPPAWSFYFRVPDIDAAAARVTAGGGTVHHGPAEVPGGDRIIIGTDPQGLALALVG